MMFRMCNPYVETSARRKLILSVPYSNKIKIIIDYR